MTNPFAEPFEDSPSDDPRRLLELNQQSIQAGMHGDLATVRSMRLEDVRRTLLGDSSYERDGRVPTAMLATGDLMMWSRHADDAQRRPDVDVRRFCTCRRYGVPCVLALDAEDLLCTACRGLCK